jgi:NADH:ubiquinone oxidoreductase subunit H
MKKITPILILTIILTLSTLFISAIPCKKWESSGTLGMVDLVPVNGFCKIFYGFSAPNKYYYLTTNPTIALIISLAISIILSLILIKIYYKIKKN